MTLKNCVKISYKGLTRPIVCDLKFEYDELLNTVLEKFNIAMDNKWAIVFYDEQGHKYNKEAFKYFLFLFPNPKKIFFIRLDATKIQRHQQRTNDADSQRFRDEYDDRIVFGTSKLNNRSKAPLETEPAVECEAVPVRRQNCFIGSYPSSTENKHQRSLKKADNMISLEIVKRMKLLKQSPTKKKKLTHNQNAFKRSLRI